MSSIFLSRLLEGLEHAGVKHGSRNKTVAEETGYAVGTINRILSGNANLTDRFIQSVCSSFNINPEWIREGKEPVLNKMVFSMPNVDEARKRFTESAARIARYNESQMTQEPEPSGVSLRNEQKVEYLCNLIKRLDPQEMNQVEEFVLNLFLKIN